MITVNQTVDEKSAVLALNGWLDVEGTPAEQEALDALPQSVHAVTLDCSGLEYISSAGLRLIVALEKKLHPYNGLKLLSVGSDVMSVLNMSGFAKHLNIE